MQIRTIKDIDEPKGKKIILRVDFNVPLDKNGDIADDNRMIQALPTIQHLQKAGTKLIIITHMGRPNGRVEAHLRLNKVAAHLSKLLDLPVHKCDDIIGKHVETDIANLQDGEIIMLENIRFRKEEKECDLEFTKEIAELGDIFVSDAFATAHRNHCSTAGLAQYLPAYAGLLMEKEIKALSPLINEKPKAPLTMIFGGAKIDTKIGVIKNFLEKADYFLIGGGLANTFLYAEGFDVASSLYEEDRKEIAQEILMEAEKLGKTILIPEDVIVASEITEDAETLDLPVEDVIGDMKILDIGTKTAHKYANMIRKSNTVIWNGPLGLYEFSPFKRGSKIVAEALENHDCHSVIGGGDTVDCLKKVGTDLSKFTHISTGGGACIEFLEGKSLPGIDILKA